MKTTTTFMALILVLSLIGTVALGQGDKSKRPSPPATAKGKIGAATITIEYSSPSVKGRTIWGELVPYDKVWRAGANEATTLETDKPITIEGKSLPAGKYSLFFLPGEKEWSLILNSETGQWGIKRGGVANLDRAKDVLVVTVKPKKSKEFHEGLAYAVTGNGFSMMWENLEVSASVK